MTQWLFTIGQQIPGIFVWDENGTRSLGSFHWKISGTNRNSENEVLFSRLGCSEWKCVFHLHVSYLSYKFQAFWFSRPCLIASTQALPWCSSGTDFGYMVKNKCLLQPQIYVQLFLQNSLWSQRYAFISKLTILWIWDMTWRAKLVSFLEKGKNVRSVMSNIFLKIYE